MDRHPAAAAAMSVLLFEYFMQLFRLTVDFVFHALVIAFPHAKLDDSRRVYSVAATAASTVASFGTVVAPVAVASLLGLSNTTRLVYRNAMALSLAASGYDLTFIIANTKSTAVSRRPHASVGLITAAATTTTATDSRTTTFTLAAVAAAFLRARALADLLTAASTTTTTTGSRVTLSFNASAMAFLLARVPAGLLAAVTKSKATITRSRPALSLVDTAAKSTIRARVPAGLLTSTALSNTYSYSLGTVVVHLPPSARVPVGLLTATAHTGTSSSSSLGDVAVHRLPLPSVLASAPVMSVLTSAPVVSVFVSRSGVSFRLHSFVASTDKFMGRVASTFFTPLSLKSLAGSITSTLRRLLRTMPPADSGTDVADLTPAALEIKYPSYALGPGEIINFVITQRLEDALRLKVPEVPVPFVPRERTASEQAAFLAHWTAPIVPVPIGVDTVEVGGTPSLPADIKAQYAAHKELHSVSRSSPIGRALKGVANRLGLRTPGIDRFAKTVTSPASTTGIAAYSETPEAEIAAQQVVISETIESFAAPKPKPKPAPFPKPSLFGAGAYTNAKVVDAAFEKFMSDDGWQYATDAPLVDTTAASKPVEHIYSVPLSTSGPMFAAPKFAAAKAVGRAITHGTFELGLDEEEIQSICFAPGAWIKPESHQEVRSYPSAGKVCDKDFWWEPKQPKSKSKVEAPQQKAPQMG
ncbi:hypothetical protein H9P43_002214 [Blastocladiella emersonii ATCC 22665]|nr:hypothetical protein H9P43_002214 [Blastocladiella emersonii ATCC 22665]